MIKAFRFVGLQAGFEAAREVARVLRQHGEARRRAVRQPNQSYLRKSENAEARRHAVSSSGEIRQMLAVVGGVEFLAPHRLRLLRQRVCAITWDANQAFIRGIGTLPAPAYCPRRW